MDPFGDLDDKMMTDLFRKKRDVFLALLSKPSKTEADLAQIREARKDPFLNVIFLFKDYYELKAMSGRTTAQDAQIATIESRYPSISRVYNDAKLKAMLVPSTRVSSDVARIQKYGIATREDAFALARGKGKGRSRRRRLTRRRRTTRKRS
jgi:hypothetical protein